MNQSNKIFGYDWSDIQRAQQGGRLSRAIDMSTQPLVEVTSADGDLLAKHGSIEALETAGFHGTADRLRRYTNEAEKTPRTRPPFQIDAGKKQIDLAPKISDLDPVSLKMWAAVSESTCGGWNLSIHDPWSDGRSRVVLTRAVFIVQFEYRQGDAAAREIARSAAIKFADANPMKRIEMFPIQCWACPQMVAFSGPLQPAGWVTGAMAKAMNGFLDAGDATGLKECLKLLASNTLEDHSTALFEAIREAGARDNRALDGTTQPATVAEVRCSLLMSDPAKLYMAENLHKELKARALKGETRALAVAYAVHSVLTVATSAVS